MTYNDLEKANSTIKTTPIKGKDYAEVNQRIKAFRMVYPEGTINTQMVSNEDGICIFKATIISDKGTVLGTGTAYEKETSSYINKTSYIENCETSAVGRALGMCGFGIDTSVASADEVTNAINNQKVELTEEEAKNMVLTFGKYEGKTIGELVIDNETSYLTYLMQQGKPEIKAAVSLLTGMVELEPEESKKEINNMPITEAQKQHIRDLDEETIKLYLIALHKTKISELTYEEANKLIGE